MMAFIFTGNKTFPIQEGFVSNEQKLQFIWLHKFFPCRFLTKMENDPATFPNFLQPNSNNNKMSIEIVFAVLNSFI